MSGFSASDPRPAIAGALARAVREVDARAESRPDIRLERPREPVHGDWASNVAMVLARQLGRPPRQLAEEIARRIDLTGTGASSVEVAGPGFLNFRLAADSVTQALAGMVVDDDAYGRSATAAGEPVIVEWVSANPTGPLHLGHGRQAALGDAICELLAATGWAVHREYYYNDTGKQMDLLARSVHARRCQLLGLPAGVPEGGYRGEYVLELAREYEATTADPIDDGDTTEGLDALRRFAVELLRREQDVDLKDFQVRFDTYYLESSLFTDGLIASTVEALEATGHVFRQDGAVWLRTTAFGDDKDRVMLRSDGTATYFLSDVAYHVTKWQRGFRRAINVQGADHHSTTTRVRAGLRALGHPQDFPEWVLHQMVRLERGGREVKLSKRAGGYTTLRELFEMVGVDVARYFFLMRRPEAQLMFDIEAALDQSEKNPVYKVQYAHARMCSIFAKAGDEVTALALAPGHADLSLLSHPAELDLAKALAEFPDLIARAAEARAPHLLCEYLEQTASTVNSWYHEGNPSRSPELAVLVPDPALRAARLVLARAARVVLSNGLRMLNVSAPVRMERRLKDTVEPAAGGGPNESSGS